MRTQEIRIADIKILNRLRKINDSKVDELTDSIKQVGLLHPLVVAKKDNSFLLLSGNHRLKGWLRSQWMVKDSTSGQRLNGWSKASRAVRHSTGGQGFNA